MKRYRGGGLNFSKRRKKLNVPLIKNVFTWIVELAIVLVLAYACVYFVGLRISVVGQAMEPTMDSGDEILVNRFSYKLAQPNRDDLIVFLPNGNKKSHYYVRRVVALPGDTVKITDGKLYVNGEEYEEQIDSAEIADAGLASEEFTVEEDEYFVLGDNRNNSEDSRYANIGNVKKEHIIGKAWFMVAPFAKFGFI